MVPLSWINERLEAEGHRWRVSVIDDEYEFADVARQSNTLLPIAASGRCGSV